MRVQGFRGIKLADVWLEAHTVLLGENGVGKSSLVDAVTLLLGRDRLGGPLSDYDFNDGFPTETSRVWIRGLFCDFRDNSIAANPQWFGSLGAVPLWLDPAALDVQPDVDATHTILCMEIGLCARFDSSTLEYETVRYFVDDEVDPFVDEGVHRLSNKQLAEFGYFLLPSSRTWDKTLSFASELFRRTLASQEGMPAQELLDLRDHVMGLPQDLESNQGFSALMDRIRAQLAGFVGADASELRLQLTTGDIKSVVDAMAMSVSTPSGFRVPIGWAGSGVRAFQTLLLLLELGRARVASGMGFILAAEEPELHLNPGLHRRLVGRVRALAPQSLVTTHSPEIAAYHRPQEILFLRNRDGSLTATPLLPAKTPIPGANALMRLFTVYRTDLCEALMNRLVLIPEGDTEHRWLRAMMRALNAAEAGDLSADSNGLGVVPTQSSSVVAAYEQLRLVNPSCVPFVDGDGAGDTYVKALLDLAAPPSRVIQLGPGQALEHLIAWIVKGDDACDMSSVSIEDVAAKSLDEVAGVLGSDEYKKRWDLHEEIAWEIASCGGARKRAAEFLQDVVLVCSGEDPALGLWVKDEVTTTAMTTVWGARLA
jgi:hypothetical protein